MKATPVGMKAVESVQAVQDGAPGSFFIETVTEGEATYKRLRVKLPHGDVGGFALEPAPAHVPGVWAWNESEKKPTLRRPIALRGRWCGRMRGGRLVSDPPPEQQPPTEHPLPPTPAPAVKVRA